MNQKRGARATSRARRGGRSRWLAAKRNLIFSKCVRGRARQICTGIQRYPKLSRLSTKDRENSLDMSALLATASKKARDRLSRRDEPRTDYLLKGRF